MEHRQLPYDIRAIELIDKPELETQIGDQEV